jgi:hypothetical protein
MLFQYFKLVDLCDRKVQPLLASRNLPNSGLLIFCQHEIQSRLQPMSVAKAPSPGVMLLALEISHDPLSGSALADISITSSILTSLGHTIQEYEAEFHFKIDNFENVKAACEKNFNNLGKAIKVVKRGESKDVIGKKIWREAAEVGVWEKLKFALGGEQSLKDLVVSIETSKSTLQLLLDSMNLLILKKLSKKYSRLFFLFRFDCFTVSGRGSRWLMEERTPSE